MGSTPAAISAPASRATRAGSIRSRARCRAAPSAFTSRPRATSAAYRPATTGSVRMWCSGSRLISRAPPSRTIARACCLHRHPVRAAATEAAVARHRPRARRLSAGPALFYATGGLAYGSVETRATQLVAGHDRHRRIRASPGWLDGGRRRRDATHLLPGWNMAGWTTKTEYLYVDLGSVNDSFATPAGLTFPLHSDLRSHVLAPASATVSIRPCRGSTRSGRRSARISPC